MELEFKVNEYQLPEKLTFNYEELKHELTEKVEMYKTLVYTDEQIKDAKSDRASLNKLKTVLNDERIKREREYMRPFAEFKEKVNEIIKIIDEPIAMIDVQVKGYEEKKKEEKRTKIESFIADVELANAEKLQEIKIPCDVKWLNASVSMKSIEDSIHQFVETTVNNLATLENLPDFAFEAVEVYKSTLDINKAISEAQRMVQIAKAKAEAEAKKSEYETTQAAKLVKQVSDQKSNVNEVNAPKKNWVRLAAHMTLDEARELKKFFDDKGIEFKAI